MRNVDVISRDERRRLRIFISSPGDVSTERVIADRVIRRLQREFRNFVDVEPVLWENLPLISAVTFQDGIDAFLKSEPVDVAIFILGARLGTSPGRNYIRVDGKPYGSGTEYEFDTMMAAYRRSGRPLVLFYKKEISEKQLIETSSVENFDAIENVIRQFKAVNRFVEEHFFDKDKDAYIAYHLLDNKSIGFEQRLEAHLRGIIAKLLPTQGDPCWSGNPYKGLLSFGIEDEAIFFGRSAVLNEIERDLFARCSSDVPRLSSVIVSGESGAGKSSFVKAGLLPDLLRTTVFPKARIEYRITTPGQLRGHLCGGLWQMLKEILPGLPDMPRLSVSDVRFTEAIADILGAAKQKRADETGLQPVPLLVIDQLEEIFTHAEITEGEQIEFAKLLSALQKSNSVSLVFTIRSDFYQNLTSCGEWLAVKKESLLCDLPRMTVDEYRQVISAPAELAGYKWEQDKRGGRWLNEVILDDAIREQITLPLLEFALADIVERSGDGRLLRFSTYKNIGGLSGAIQRRADEVYKSLSSDEKAALFRILGSLITVSSDGKYVRTETSVKTVVSDKVMHKVMDVFVDNRLFSVSGDEAKGPTVTIAHEALISQWKVIQDWIQREEQLIQAKRECEVASEKWYASKKNELLLLTSPASLAQAEDLLICWPHGLSPRVSEFVANSFKKKTRKSIFLRAVATTGYLVCLVFLIVCMCSSELWPQIRWAWQMGSLPLLSTSFKGLTIGYSLVQRFRGCPGLIRAKMDLRVYALALLLVTVSTFVQEQICSIPIDCDVDVYNDVYNESGMYLLRTLVNGGWILLLICLVLRSMIRVRHASLRQRRLRSFEFQQSFGIRLLGSLASTMGYILVLTFMVFFWIFGLVFWVKKFSDATQLKDASLSIAELVAEGQSNVLNEKIVEAYAMRRKGKEIIGPREAKVVIKAKLAIGQGEEVLGDTNLLRSIDGDAEKTNLMCRCYSAIGDEESAYYWAKDDVAFDAYVKLRLALKLGKTADASEIFAGLARPPSFPLTSQLLNYAHGMLLCSNSLTEAVALYRDIEKDVRLKNSLLSDLVLLKRQPEYRSRIVEVESQLSSEPIPELNGELLNIADDLPWLGGTWRWKVGDEEFDMEIDPERKINCRYGVYHIYGHRRAKVMVDGSILHVQKQHGAGEYKVEEFFPLTGVVRVGLWNHVDENTIMVEVLYSGNDIEKGRKRMYKRLSSNEVAVVQGVYSNTQKGE